MKRTAMGWGAALLLVLVSIAGPLWAAEYYVSPSGSDSNPGTEAAPFATPNQALREAASGDTVILRQGTYVGEEIRFETPNVTMKSYPGEWAVLNNPDPDDITIQFRLGSDGSKLERLEVTGAFYAIKMQSNWDWDEPTRFGASNITITDCKIHDTANACIKVTPGCDDITVQGCEIYNSGVTDPGSAEAIDNVNGDRMTVTNCYIHDIRGAGLYAKGGAIGMRVDRCMVVNCDGGGVMIGFDTSPEWFDLGVNPDYYENIDGMVTNCIIINTQYAGIGMYGALNPRVYNNTLINTAQEGHAAIYFGLTYQDWDPVARRPSTVNPIIRNNIAVNTSSVEALAVEIRYSEDIGQMSALSGMPTMNNNIYYWAHGSPQFADNRPGSTMLGDLGQWKAHISGGANSRVVDPLLDANYRLSAGSPAIDAGFTWTEEGQTTSDYDGAIRVIPYDIGADEYQ